MANIRPTHSPELAADAVQEAANLLRAGELVVLPTETVYGLAARAQDARAVKKIFEVKGRPAHNPVIVHVAGHEMARRCAATWPHAAEKLARAFWPGPLTLVLPCAAVIPAIITAGGSTVGIRWPAHPVFQAVIEACDFPLAAPSANRSGELSPTTAAHAQRALGDQVGLILDGGPAQIGIESTVLDVSVSPPRILRPGMIHAESLEAVIGQVAFTESTQPGPLRSPGLLQKHYSPKARLRVWEGTAEGLADLIRQSGADPSRVHLLRHRASPTLGHVGQLCAMPRDPRAFARALYAELHHADEAGAALIVVEAVPDSAEWQGIADRLRRASAQ
ncbi:MAG: L-threonylcarbamoyladenylate synthase [Verrucomicrobiia bacterium]